MSAPDAESVASKQKEPLVAASNAAETVPQVAAAPQVEAETSKPAAETSVAAPQVEAAAPQVEAAAPQVEAETSKPVAAPPNAAETSNAAPNEVAPNEVAPNEVAPQVEAAQVEAASNAAETPVVPNPVTLPQDKSYSTALGAVVHAFAELYGIKDNANVVITSDKVSAANFKATIEANDDKLTITMTPVADSEGVTALTEIKSKLAAPKPEPAVEPVKQVEAAAEKPVEAEPVKQVEAAAEAEAGKLKEVAVKAEGGYRRRKRNLRTIKKQQQRNRRTMNKH